MYDVYSCIQTAEKEGSAYAQMNTPLHQASQAEGVDWSHIPQITQRASESGKMITARWIPILMSFIWNICLILHLKKTNKKLRQILKLKL